MELADREAWPTPVLGVQYAHEGGIAGPDNDIVLGTLELPLPLWQRNQSERARSRAEAATSLAEEESEARALEARIARAHAELTTAVARLEAFGANVTPALADSLALLERGFGAGEIPLMDLILARQRFLGAERDRLDAHADYYRALADLESASGSELYGRGEP